jgi:ABC-2 type transport system permease protein
MEFYSAVAVMFSGQFVPLQVMPPLVQTIAGYLPFRFFVYFPIQIILGKVPMDEYGRTLAVGLVWLLLAYLLFRWVWREGLKHFSAVGA